MSVKHEWDEDRLQLSPSENSNDMGDNSSLASQGLVKLEQNEDVEFTFRNSEGVAYRMIQVDADVETASPKSIEPVKIAQNSTQCQYYVIETAGNFPPSPRNISPKTSATRSVNSPIVKKRDDRRRATHNEVERRRRDKINNWIMKLGNILPETAGKPASVGNFEGQSKGIILSKALDYIADLKDENEKLTKCLKENKKVVLDNKRLRDQIEQLQQENEMLRKVTIQSGHS